MHRFKIIRALAALITVVALTGLLAPASAFAQVYPTQLFHTILTSTATNIRAPGTGDLSQAYDTLYIIGRVKDIGTTVISGGAHPTINVQVNGDAGANYAYVAGRGWGSGGDQLQSFAVSMGMPFANMPNKSSSYPSHAWTTFECWAPGYADAVGDKFMNCVSSFEDGTLGAGQIREDWSIRWYPSTPAAIKNLLFYPADPTNASTSLEIGTIIDVYGE
jgi:hypothetical protein